MLGRRGIVIGLVAVVGLIFLYAWFGTSSSTSTRSKGLSTTEIKEGGEGGASSPKTGDTTAKLLQHFFERIQLKEEDIETKLSDMENQFKSHLRRLEDGIKNLPTQLTAADNKDTMSADIGQLFDKLSKKIQVDLEGWTQKQDNFLSTIEEVVKSSAERVEEVVAKAATQHQSSSSSTASSTPSSPSSLSHPSPPPLFPSPAASPFPIKKDTDRTAQDEIEALYDQEENDKKNGNKKDDEEASQSSSSSSSDTPKKAQQGGGAVEEISDTDLDSLISTDNYITISDNEPNEPEKEATDADKGNLTNDVMRLNQFVVAPTLFLGCDDDLEELIVKNIPALSNHVVNR